MVMVELLLGDLNGLGEILVGQLRVDDLVAVLGEVRRFDAAWDRTPAVKEEDRGHVGIVSTVGGFHLLRFPQKMSKSGQTSTSRFVTIHCPTFQRSIELSSNSLRQFWQV